MLQCYKNKAMNIVMAFLMHFGFWFDYFYFIVFLNFIDREKKITPLEVTKPINSKICVFVSVTITEKWRVASKQTSQKELFKFLWIYRTTRITLRNGFFSCISPISHRSIVFLLTKRMSRYSSVCHCILV